MGLLSNYGVLQVARLKDLFSHKFLVLLPVLLYRLDAHKRLGFDVVARLLLYRLLFAKVILPDLLIVLRDTNN